MLACYEYQIGQSYLTLLICMDKGYEATINLMAVSTVTDRRLDEVLADVAKSRVTIFYLVDSFGEYV
jgi:4-hydroxy 2-oxovalerate aldolase